MFRLLCIAMAVSLVCCGIAAAHPSIENSMEVVVHPDRVTIDARISLPEVDIEQTIDDDGVGPVDSTKLRTAIEKHGTYVAEHIHVLADQTPLKGRVVSWHVPDEAVAWEDFDQHEARYVLEYPFAGASPSQVHIDHDLLDGFTRLGQGWAVNFMARIRQSDDAEFTQHLLTLEQSIDYPLHRYPATQETIAPAYSAPTAADTRLDTASIASSYLVHGLHHILTGYDHLLFVAALVLAATRLWDLVKVVTAFAVAHTLTLTLSVLNLVRLPSSVVEPVIAGSIVFVALQNALFPRQSQGAARLAIAFIFGLFHGLGFAGGLLEAMEGMPGVNLVVALVAFTLGVELAHQLLIVPLYLILKPLRARFSRGVDAEQIAEPLDASLAAIRVPVFIRAASFAISLAGMLYLVAALSGR